MYRRHGSKMKIVSLVITLCSAQFTGRYCGKTLPPIEAHFNPYLHVTFHSDELGAFKGFKAEFSGAKGALKLRELRHIQLVQS